MSKIFLVFISFSIFSSLSFAEFEIGGTLYTTHGFYAEKGKSYTTNYRAGYCIPRGSEVAVLSVRGNKATLSVKHNGLGTVKLINVKKYSGMEMSDYLDRMMTKTKPNNKEFAKKMRDDIERCAPRIDMTKGEVIAAIGYPPQHKTPSGDMSEWRYWRKRFDKEVFYFKDGKLLAIQD